MDTNRNIQIELFNKIKQKTNPNLTLVHEVSEILDLSYDSTYRRIRGDQFLNLEEIVKLCSHYGISVDALCNSSMNSVTFESFTMDPEKFRFKDWLNMVLRDIRMIKESPNKQIIYASKDPAIYHYFVIPEIIAFKAFMWEKTVFQFPDFKDKKFTFDAFDSETLSLGMQLSKLAALIPTIELWNADTMLLVFRQIEYYWIAGLFERMDDVKNLLDKVEKWIIHIRQQAELGFKFIYNSPPEGPEDTFRLYETEVIKIDNLIFVDLGDKRATYIAANSLNLLKTTNPYYCEQVKKFLHGIMLTSNLISHSGEKERNRLFNKYLYLLEELRRRIY